MSLSRKIADAVESQPPIIAPPVELTVEDGDRRLSLSLVAASPIGVAFDRLAFFAPADPPADADALKRLGDRLAKRITYLMEPLVVLEVDAEAGEAELRSAAPSVKERRRTYYEIRVRRGGSLELRRIAFDEETRRRSPIPCQMTLETLERLADDLVAAVA